MDATAQMNAIVAEAQAAFCRDDASGVRDLLRRYPALQSQINEPVCGFDSPLINHVRSRAMLDVLLEAGADINARSRWWAGGFGLLDSAAPDLAAYAIQRGAQLTVHAAARLNMLAELQRLIAADPQLVHERGGDGQTPLHFAASVEIASYLLDQGADIDARDIDHESTPAQYMLGDRADVARFLVTRGCWTDLLMATSLGDRALVQKLLTANPDCIRTRVSDEYFPMIGERTGGTIYQWKLGWYVSAPQVAKADGNDDLYLLLDAHAPLDERLLNACWLHDEARVRQLLAENPGMVQAMPAAGRRHLAHAARNNDTAAARLMLEAGLPIDALGQHRATPLHWAAWHGNLELVNGLLAQRPSLEDASNEYHSTPLGWAIHGSENGWHCEQGDYPAVAQALLTAGAALPKQVSGSPGVAAVLKQAGVQ